MQPCSAVGPDFSRSVSCKLSGDRRRNHSKGICFSGVFESNGAGTKLSSAQVFARGEYPALGRINLGTENPNASDASLRVRGMGLQISAPNGERWRSAMINAPVFTVSTPQARVRVRPGPLLDHLEAPPSDCRLARTSTRHGLPLHSMRRFGRKKSIGLSVAFVTARSARISPKILANLNP